MNRTIDIKHVEPRAHVKQLLDERIDRLAGKLRHFPSEALSVHVVFEENGPRTLYRTSLTCHVPGRVVAARQEHRDPGLAIKKAFTELERQLDKQKSLLRREHLRTRSSPSNRILGDGALTVDEPEEA